MPIKTLRKFQETAIQSAVDIFSYAKSMLDAAGADAEGRAAAIYDNGYLLIEAPTGSGKTLMAGHIAEKMANLDDVVWFWFAPFKGVVEQTASFLREQFAGLRLRTLNEDRNPTGTRKGDIFVTTWQTVATRVKDRRNVRKTGEQNPSIDDLIESLRDQGMRIGVVVDEAHHGFHKETQAAEFFRGVLKPEYTILVTATPDDADLADLRKRMKVERIHRISISRTEAVESGLIKDGIKTIAWIADADSERIVDFEATALREGVALHRAIQGELEAAKISLVPLLLVQVGSGEKSIERTKQRLLDLGFTDRQIAVHTSDEPDPGLLAIANDETREVLIFKMAVALGFDAPRAWTLVSMRAAKDEDFGVQLVGRILRVHRRLQGRKVPEALRFGYVLLADAESQQGLDAAGQRINQIRTEFAKLSPTTMVVKVGDRETVQYVGSSGQQHLIPVSPPGAVWTPAPERAATEDKGTDPDRFVANDLFELIARKAEERGEKAERPLGLLLPSPVAGVFRYQLRKDVPQRFQTLALPEDLDVTEEECAAHFALSADDLLQALIRSRKVQVKKRTLEIFSQLVQTEFAFTDTAPAQLRLLAQRELLKSEVFHPKDLRAALLDRLKQDFAERGMEEAGDTARVSQLLDLLLATRPELLREAQQQALRKRAEVQDADPLPHEIMSEEPLATSRHNIYGAVPRGLNRWETEFGEFLDADTSGIVLWWHRNPPLKPWSVKVLLADGRGFFPDFVVGVDHRKNPGHALLTDTKFAYDTNREMPKILAEHPTYGRVLILSKNEKAQWAVVEMDPTNFRAKIGKVFRLADAPYL